MLKLNAIRTKKKTTDQTCQDGGRYVFCGQACTCAFHKTVTQITHAELGQQAFFLCTVNRLTSQIETQINPRLVWERLVLAVNPHIPHNAETPTIHAEVRKASSVRSAHSAAERITGIIQEEFRKKASSVRSSHAVSFKTGTHTYPPTKKNSEFFFFSLFVAFWDLHSTSTPRLEQTEKLESSTRETHSHQYPNGAHDWDEGTPPGASWLNITVIAWLKIAPIYEASESQTL